MLGCDQFFYYPRSVQYDSPARYRITYEDVFFKTPDGLKLHGWFFPAVGDTQGTVLHIHGNAGNITGHFHHVAWLPEAGYNVLCFDYRGYGRSEGRVTRAGTIIDTHAALDFLLIRDDVDSNRIVAFGQSLGGAIGIVLAADRKEIKALVTDGAFDGYRRITRWHISRNPVLFVLGFWVPWLMGNDYDPIDVIADISPRPILIVQGTADRVVCPAMAQRLYDAATEPKELWMVPGTDHYGAMQDHAEEAQSRISRFFSSALKEGSAEAGSTGSRPARSQ